MTYINKDQVWRINSQDQVECTSIDRNDQESAAEKKWGPPLDVWSATRRSNATIIAVLAAIDRKCARTLGFKCGDIGKLPQKQNEPAHDGPMLKVVMPGDGHCLLRAVLDQVMTCFGMSCADHEVKHDAPFTINQNGFDNAIIDYVRRRLAALMIQHINLAGSPVDLTREGVLKAIVLPKDNIKIIRIANDDINEWDDLHRAQRISSATELGEGEMLHLTQLLGVNIHVFTDDHLGQYKEIVRYNTSHGEGNAQTAKVLYDGESHYDGIIHLHDDRRKVTDRASGVSHSKR